MLAPGIYLSGIDTDHLSRLHPTWADDVLSLGPWLPEGDMLKSGGMHSSTVVVRDSCESTMEVARSLVQDGSLEAWGAVVSGVQTGGRGQLRRPWASLPGNLHVSTILPDPPEGGEWGKVFKPLLPLVMGYVVCTVLETLGARLKIKWPNDILESDRKVGGMLIEERNDCFILGMGLNLVGCPPDEELREEHSVQAGKIAIPSLSGGPLTLAGLLVNRGENVYMSLLDEIPPTQFIAMVESRLAWMGRSILIREGNETPSEATVAGLSPDGGLVILRGGEERVLYSGSIFPL